MMNIKKLLLTTLTTLTLFGVVSTFFDENIRNTEAYLEYSPVTEGNKRIWFITGSDAGWWFDGGANTRISWWINDSYFDSGTNYMTRLPANGFYYHDIPSTATGLQFRRVSPDNTTVWNYTDSFGIGVDSEYFLYEVVDAQFGGGSAGGNNNNDKNVNKIDRFTAGFMEDKIDDYFTCSSSIVNGYGDVPFLRMGYYDTMRQSEKDNFAASTRILHDYNFDEYVANNNSYEGLTQTEANGAIPKAKWNAMEARYKNFIDASYPSLNL